MRLEGEPERLLDDEHDQQPAPSSLPHVPATGVHERVRQEIKGTATGPSKRAQTLRQQANKRARTGESLHLWQYYSRLYARTHEGIVAPDDIKRARGMLANLSKRYSELTCAAMIDCFLTQCTGDDYFVLRSGHSVQKLVGMLPTLLEDYAEWIAARARNYEAAQTAGGSIGGRDPAAAGNTAEPAHG